MAMNEKGIPADDNEIHPDGGPADIERLEEAPLLMTEQPITGQ